MSLTDPKYPGERLIACRNPALAAKRSHKRTALLEASEEKLETIKKAVEAGRPRDAGNIGVKVGKIGTYNMAKHFDLTTTDETFAYARNEQSIKREADLDGIYVIRTNLPDTAMDAPEAVRTYKSLANVEKGTEMCFMTAEALLPVRKRHSPGMQPRIVKAVEAT